MTRVIVPALGAAAGVPEGLPLALGEALGVPAPPVVAAALSLRQASSAIAAARHIWPATRGRTNPLLFKPLSPLFPSPAELADGLALKESRYGRFSSDSPLRPARSLRFLRSRTMARTGFGYLLGRQYRQLSGGPIDGEMAIIPRPRRCVRAVFAR